MKPYPYRQGKVLGYVSNVGPRSFFVQITTPKELNNLSLELSNDKWPAGAYDLPTEGVLVSWPSRRDRKFVQTPLRPWTQHQIKRARVEGRQLWKALQ